MNTFELFPILLIALAEEEPVGCRLYWVTCLCLPLMLSTEKEYEEQRIQEFWLGLIVWWHD